MKTPSASYSVTLRAEYPNHIGAVGQILTTIAEAGGDVGAVDIVQQGERTRAASRPWRSAHARHTRSTERVESTSTPSRSNKMASHSNRSIVLSLSPE